MTTPIHVVQSEGLGTEIQKAIAPLLDAYQRRRELELRDAELKQRKAEAKQRADDRTADQNALGAAGEFLKGLLLLQEAGQGGAAPQTTTDMQPGGQAMPPVGGGGPIPFEAMSPAGLGQALASPAGPAPMSALAQLIQQTPAVAIPQAVSLSQDIRAMLAKQQEGAAQERAVNAALDRISDPDMRADFAAYANLRRSGADMPVGMAQALFPKLFPQGVDPDIMNSALRYGVAGGLSWGQVRSLFKLPPTTGVPDDFRFPVTLGGRQTERQQVAQLHYTAMRTGQPGGLIDGLLDKTGGLNFYGQVQNEINRLAGSGNSITSLVGGIGRMVTNGLIPDDQRQLIQAMGAWTNSLRYLMTGAQSNAQELAIILATTTALSTDDPATKAQKIAYIHAMTEAAGRMAAGQLSPKETADQLITQAQGLNMDPKLIDMLRGWQKSAGSGTASVPLLTRDPQDAQQQVTDAILMQLIMGAGRGP